ncbi:hypothetical protein K461DRAFT_292405 [Myriangium duriaei CBS 260.36]|uniref:Phytanoyl-CoA dioxygenase n=1 Tax=Myriangium duriaei CBS 260.36 TaxID=1168546 RepID=A0A9P4ML02_9PEZI|nr:hypothetical protein K461DRAFT_292405 [Myriangium duriaei CBS 260.36]
MDSPLNEADVEHFLTHGWVKVSGCFSKSQADDLTTSLWVRLGMSPTNKSTWTRERIHMPSQQTFDSSVFAPKAWTAICQLLGGKDRVAEWSRTWRDSFIVNLGTTAGEGRPLKPHQLYDWHVDGDFFMHYLDSPEQGLLVIPLFADIKPGGGGTFICPPAVKSIAQHLYDHPEGVSPRMLPRGVEAEFGKDGNLLQHQRFYINLAKSFPESAFVEVTGSVGDVFLLHPLMLHGASNNALRIPRVITNPPIALKKPFDFDRKNIKDFSIVERKTLRDLGKENLQGWRITHERERLVPDRIRQQEQMKKEEAKRLAALNS